MRELTACGVICFYQDTFLLMKHENRFDLPKGHQADGESDLDTALRELEEETGISAHQIVIDPEFSYSVTYYPIYEKYGGELVEKTTTIFVGYLQEDVEITPTEHIGYEWIDWQPPHIIQRETINGLMAAIEQHFAERGNPSEWQNGAV